jgi:hypothetical protein
VKRLLVLLVAVVATVVLASAYLPTSAATVGGTSISRQSLDSDLSAIAGSPDYTCFLSEERQLAGERPLPLLGAGSPSASGGVYDTTFVDDWLGSMITGQVTGRLVADARLRVTAADLAVARAVLSRRITDVLDQYASDTEGPAACGGSGSAVLASLPAWFVREQTRAEADQAVLDARAAGSGLGAGQVAAYYATHQRTFDRYCLSIIVVDSVPAAGQAAAAIDSGTSFATEAAAASTTAATGSRGGVAGCGILAGTFLAPHVAELAVGTVSKPFAASGRFWLVEVTSRTTVPLPSVRSRVETAILAAGATRANAEVDAGMKRAAVTLDPRYGTLAAHRITLIVPPAAPPPGAMLSVGADTPTLTAASI